jgi:uncharacterized protein YegJ (DUF2314 family)
MMKNRWVYILLSLVLLSCGMGKNKEQPQYEQRVNRNGGDDVISVADEDKRMNMAIENAKKTLPEFDKALQEKNKKTFDFYLKATFNNEHLWFSDITMENGTYQGMLANDPESEVNKKMKLGDIQQITQDMISDWQYSTADTIFGSYTTRVLREMMTKTERDDFDEQTGFIYK